MTMVAKIFHEFTYSRVITNVFLVFVLVGQSFLTPFFPLYLKYLRLSALEAGIICCAQAASEMLLAPVWVFAVRRSRDSHKKRALVVLSLLLTAAIYVCFVFVPPAGSPDDVTHCMAPQRERSGTLPAPLTTPATVVPANAPTNMTTQRSTTTRQMVTSTSTVSPSTSTSAPAFYPITEAPQVDREPETEGAEYPSYGEPVDENNAEDLTSIKRRPPPPIWQTWDSDPAYYDTPYSSRKLQSFELMHLEDTRWLYSPVFRAAFLLATFSAALGCLAEPAVSTLWTQRLDDTEHLEQRGEYVVWARFFSSVALALLATLMTFLSPCFVARGLHQTVVLPLAAAGTLAGASLLGLVLLPLPSGKLPAVPGLPKARTVAPVSGLRLVFRGISTVLAAAASTAGTLFLLWHVSTLPPHGFRHNYALLYGGFAALEALCAVPVLGWSRSPSSVTAPSPGRAALGLMVLALQFGLAPLLKAPAPLPLLGALQGAGGALLERSLGRAHSSSSWRLGCALGALGAGVVYSMTDIRVTMWGAGALALVAALAVLITGR
ncbi:hypothetical protein B566_EDAN010652 [Ephemera danica]|nr:hypothetical protein B566_EDAN010652 [Ephemera danica]